MMRSYILAELSAERDAQIEKHGDQAHLPDVDAVLTTRPGGCTSTRMALHYEIPTGNRAKFLCDNAFRNGVGTWGHILIEEVAESIEAAVDDPAELRAELVQVAAVAVAWCEAIDRRASG